VIDIGLFGGNTRLGSSLGFGGGTTSQRNLVIDVRASLIMDCEVSQSVD
jgi:hypothetical protein